ncbi:hypothetical protein QTG54_002687 [Skeletonema marinoi]|uniref:Uncharacterized protein n=1 Tax=Skeletonema marinoi TaxID=267567 RepID=A0AAD8YIG5_9STRA|nr:hypothetical protein QTG54_002687 [Skeletonema marinoi]
MKVVVSRLLVLLASAQAFQLQNNNNDHHLVSLTHQHQPTQPLDNTIIHLPLDNKPTNKKKKLLLSNFYSPQTAATQINRTVNRNTKNRQNQSKCSFDTPHSTLLDITTTSHHHHHSNGNNKKKNEKNIQRSLRQLGITIASTFLIVTQARVSVANAAAAYTPLLVTHPSGVGSTAITPLLSTLPYHGMAIVPSSLFNMKKLIKGGGLSPAVGEIVMSFAYVIIALGVSHYLMRVAEGGHVKLLKLLAWQNLADDDGGTVASSSSTTTKSSTTTTSTTKSNNKEGRGIQGLVSRYTYMVQLIFNEIRKAHRVGQTLIPATTTTTAPMATTFPPNMMLSRYASLLNRSFQETYNKDHHHPDNDDESTILTSWKEYSIFLQDKMKNKKKWKKQTSPSSSRDFGKGGLVYNKFAMMFERVSKSDSEAEATKKATDLFQQKQYEQHHHHVHVPRSAIEESSYLDSLTRFAVGEDELLQHEHKQAEGYLDTLSKEGARKSTWEVYKDQVEKAKKEKENHDEVDYLKEELVHVQSLLQDEQSMYQTSNQALNLVVEAQNEELKHARAATTNTQGHQHSTMDELKEFDIKAKEYDEAIKESKELEKSDNASTPPHEWIF